MSTATQVQTQDPGSAGVNPPDDPTFAQQPPGQAAAAAAAERSDSRCRAGRLTDRGRAGCLHSEQVA